VTLQMKQDTGGTVTLQAATSGTATATVPAIAGVVSVELKGADIASATTTDLSAATGDFIDVTGTTTITGLGTLAAGIERTVRFTGALTLTHNATSLILPGAANITTAANDRAIFRSLGSGNWLCVSYNKASGAAVVSSGGGLTNWSESAGTYSSKDWKRFYPVSGTNVNAVFSPLGTGSIQAHVADGTSTGGNQRGSNAVDWQSKRSSADMVASGNYSIIPGGRDNKATGSKAVALGSGLVVTASYAIGIGVNCLSDGGYGSIACGYTSTTHGIKGAFAFTGHNVDEDSTILGKPQRCEYVLMRRTTDATANQVMKTTGGSGAAGTTNQIVLPNYSTYTYHARVSVHCQGGSSGWTNRAAWIVQGAAARDANAASTVVTSPTYTVLSNTPGYTLTVDADTTNGALRFKVTGASAKDLIWCAHVVVAEVTANS